MLFRLLFPYLFLLIIVLSYLYYRYMKLGPVILKVERQFLSRYNNDSFLLIIILAAASYFLMQMEIGGATAADEALPLGPVSTVIFYLVLMLAVIAREAERPAIRERGISTSRGFWLWSEIESFRWNKNVVSVTIQRGARKRGETWQVRPDSKKELDQVLKTKVPKRAGKGKK